MGRGISHKICAAPSVEFARNILAPGVGLSGARLLLLARSAEQTKLALRIKQTTLRCSISVRLFVCS
jgi:hypothetical protein